MFYLLVRISAIGAMFKGVGQQCPHFPETRVTTTADMGLSEADSSSLSCVMGPSRGSAATMRRSRGEPQRTRTARVPARLAGK